MVRVPVHIEVDKELFVSAFKDKNDKLVMVITNYGTSDINLQLVLKNAKKRYKTATTYVTNTEDGVDMKLMPRQTPFDVIKIEARSIQTVLID